MSESAAPQTATNVETASVQEPIQVTGGDAPVSFDELEGVSNWQARAKEQEAPKAEKKAEPKQEVKAAKADKEEKAEKTEKVEKADKKEAEAKTADAPKQIKFKVGDKDVDLASNAMVTVKVDGKAVEVPVQEVINRYSQQKHLDKLFRDYKDEKTKFDTERKTVSDVISKSYEMLAQKKDLRGFIEYMSEALGVDGQKLYSDAVDQIRQAAEADATLTPEERRLKQLEEENQFYRTKVESERTAKAQAQQTKALEAQVEQIMSAHGLDKASFVKAYDELVSTGIEPAKVTPEMVGKYYANVRTISAIEQKLSDINPNAANAANVEKLATLAIQTGATEAEMEEVIQQLYANEAEKKLAKKFNKTMKAKAAEGPKRAGSDPLFFDDLGF